MNLNKLLQEKHCIEVQIFFCNALSSVNVDDFLLSFHLEL